MNYSHVLGCLNIASSILLGAAGAHKKGITKEGSVLVDKAKFYQFVSGVGMIVSSFHATFSVSSSLFIAGIALFSGSLYHQGFTGNKDLSKRFPPFGGMAMAIGWTLLAFKR